MFSIGEWVQRKADGKVGVVKKTEPYNGDVLFYVEFPRESGQTWAGTSNAWTAYFRTHAHVSTASRDCDGDYTGGHLDRMTLQERCDQFGDIHFKDRVMANVVSLHSVGELRVSPLGLEWYEDTEEGYRRASVTWCEDDCDEEQAWHRDHRAEAAGY